MTLTDFLISRMEWLLSHRDVTAAEIAEWDRNTLEQMEKVIA